MVKRAEVAATTSCDRSGISSYTARGNQPLNARVREKGRVMPGDYGTRAYLSYMWSRAHACGSNAQTVLPTLLTCAGSLPALCAPHARTTRDLARVGHGTPRQSTSTWHSHGTRRMVHGQGLSTTVFPPHLQLARVGVCGAHVVQLLDRASPPVHTPPHAVLIHILGQHQGAHRHSCCSCCCISPRLRFAHVARTLLLLLPLGDDPNAPPGDHDGDGVPGACQVVEREQALRAGGGAGHHGYRMRVALRHALPLHLHDGGGVVCVQPSAGVHVCHAALIHGALLMYACTLLLPHYGV